MRSSGESLSPLSIESRHLGLIPNMVKYFPCMNCDITTYIILSLHYNTIYTHIGTSPIHTQKFIDLLKFTIFYRDLRININVCMFVCMCLCVCRGQQPSAQPVRGLPPVVIAGFQRHARRQQRQSTQPDSTT